MKSRVQLATVKLLDPRVQRVLLMALFLALALLGPAEAAHATVCPGGASGVGCSGG